LWGLRNWGSHRVVRECTGPNMQIEYKSLWFVSVVFSLYEMEVQPVQSLNRFSSKLKQGGNPVPPAVLTWLPHYNTRPQRTKDLQSFHVTKFIAAILTFRLQGIQHSHVDPVWTQTPGSEWLGFLEFLSIFRCSEEHNLIFRKLYVFLTDFCGLVVRVSSYRPRGPGFGSRRYQIFWEVVGLERSPLSLVSINEELLEWKNSGSGFRKTEINGRWDPLRRPRDTLYPQWH
jgi:hypothetical protein